jgi:energy-coupling factor transport system substrate-specific component
MKAAIRMWSNTRMIILVAVCAAVYAAALLAFKTAIPLVPGITEVRIAGVFPMTMGLLFGPAGAWGLAMGNLIGDLFGGTLGPGSLAGFVGNFLMGYLPYTMWTAWTPFADKSRDWQPRRWQTWVRYILISVISSAAAAVVIGAFVDALGIVPYAVLSKIIALNNTVGCLFGIVLIAAIFEVTRRHLGLFWADVMEPDDIGRPWAGALGAWVVTGGTIIGMAGGLVAGVPMSIAWVCAAAILAGSLLL